LAPRSAAATILCLFLSTLVPIWAAVTPSEPPLAPKVIDGVLAIILALLLVALHQLVGRAVAPETKAKAFDICKWVAVLPLLLFVIYARWPSLKWDVLLIGLGWRSWYLVTVLPFVLEARRR
jgi:hypothetical protein